MKRAYKKYILLSVFISLLLFGLKIPVSYIIDPVGLNNKFDFGLIKDPGGVNRTQKFLEINQVKPDTIMFGGSRVEFINTKDVEKYTKDKVYNLAMTFSTLHEQYVFLKYAIDKCDIKNVVIGLNLYLFSGKLWDKMITDFDRELFNTGFTLKKQLKHYFEVSLVDYIKHVYFVKKYNKPIYNNGSRTASSLAPTLIEPWEDREKRSFKVYIDIYKNYLILSDKRLNTFRAMVKLCKENDINLTVYTTAVYTSQLKILDVLNKMDVFYAWKKELVEITDYYDFMYPNTITKNSNNYIDTSHLKQEKGYLYFAKIFNDRSIEVPEDFGTLVNKDNIHEHLEFLKEQNKYLDSHKD